MDMSLDEIISTKPKGGRRGGSVRRRSAGRAQILGKPAAAPVHKTRAATAAAAQASKATAANAPQPTNADKIIVSNLPPDVNEAQVKELFTSTVGQLREATLHYDASGRSKGVAAVHFQRKGDGHKAYQLYNNKLIDGTSAVPFSASRNSLAVIKIFKTLVEEFVRGSVEITREEVATETKLRSNTERPMKIEIVVDPIKGVPLASRVAGAPTPAAAAPAAPSRAGPGVRRRRGGRGGGGGNGGAKRAERPQKSAADLDAEMEDYTAAASAPAAAPAAAV